jgi:hypothetical protein
VEIDCFRPSFPVDCTDSKIGLCSPPVPVNFAASLEWCGGASARPAGHRNRAARERRRNPGFGRRTGKSRNAIWAGRRRENRRGREWRELERTGRKEGEGRGRKLEETEEEAEENVTEPATGKTKTEAEYYPEEIRVEGGGERTWKRCEERSGENWRELDARKGKEGEGSGGKHEWTRAERSVEEAVSDRGENWRELDARKGKEGEGSGEREGGGNAPGERR